VNEGVSDGEGTASLPAQVPQLHCLADVILGKAKVAVGQASQIRLLALCDRDLDEAETTGAFSWRSR
jgi:hypothetical protein